jgi:hypothetical protein
MNLLTHQLTESLKEQEERRKYVTPPSPPQTFLFPQTSTLTERHNSMAHLQINFDEVPDKMLPVGAGIYLCTVVSAELGPTKDGKGEKITVVLKIDDESSQMHGRQIWDHIGLKGLPIGLKQLARSCGVDLSKGLDTEELVGKTCKCRVTAGTYKDPSTGEIKDSTRVAEYLWDK